MFIQHDTCTDLSQRPIASKCRDEFPDDRFWISSLNQSRPDVEGHPTRFPKAHQPESESPLTAFRVVRTCFALLLNMPALLHHRTLAPGAGPSPINGNAVVQTHLKLCNASVFQKT